MPYPDSVGEETAPIDAIWLEVEDERCRESDFTVKREAIEGPRGASEENESVCVGLGSLDAKSLTPTNKGRRRSRGLG